MVVAGGVEDQVAQDFAGVGGDDGDVQMSGDGDRVAGVVIQEGLWASNVAWKLPPGFGNLRQYVVDASPAVLALGQVAGRLQVDGSG